jgi:hypothetical protein
MAFKAPPAVLFSNQFYEDAHKLYEVTESLAGFNPDHFTYLISFTHSNTSFVNSSGYSKNGLCPACS